MSVAEKPVFVFVPAACHTADTFDGILAKLTQKGFDYEAVPTPSVGTVPPNKGLHADIDYSKALLQDLADKGRQVVLVTHSYGGMVGAGAAKGLGYSQHSKAGSPGEVIMDDGYTYSSQQEVVFYHDMSPEEQQAAIGKPKGQPTQTFLEPAGLPLVFQEAFAKTLGNPVAFHTDGSHSAFLSVPDQVVEGLELALKEGRNRAELM
ncbi:uncharacterized protein N7498_010379 [Penicillium cinerascens]|uniref:AB hydrolase-1 domain-containing protein n=1 Tax=Penicillium cinerascens TaxID=70096 RepID=A0A9W9M7A5_9EURO|nr:uncharacterized protein N7498_010379 [Penicillium cinerascens]KAJ5191394.1 hypothetical protein N7498_010379 [Penicillium cinerascens]